jgi:hypothetical protein
MDGEVAVYVPLKQNIAGDTEKGRKPIADYIIPDQARGGNEVFVRANDPIDDFIDAGRRLGMPQGVLEDIRKRFRVVNGDMVLDTSEKLETGEILNMINSKIRMGFEFLDGFVMSKANLQSLTTSIAILIDKRQLLSGEPTHILSHDDRQNMKTLLPALMAEVERRGMTIEHHVEHNGDIEVQVLKDVTP